MHYARPPLPVYGPRPTGEEYIEALLEHSKTKHKRWVTAVGLSKGVGRVRLAELLREYWRLAGFSIVHRVRGGYHVEGPDYSVIRVSLVTLSDRHGGDSDRLQQLVGVLRKSRVAEARQWADYIALRGGERLKADSLEKRYINVIGAASGASRGSTR